ncbi:MAG: hypothetical protein J6N52_03730 [Clostridia bacterium]|nr:hypothetical protein [Clostridia bacterium]
MIEKNDLYSDLEKEVERLNDAVLKIKKDFELRFQDNEDFSDIQEEDLKSKFGIIDSFIESANEKFESIDADILWLKKKV